MVNSCATSRTDHPRSVVASRGDGTRADEKLTAFVKLDQRFQVGSWAIAHSLGIQATSLREPVPQGRPSLRGGTTDGPDLLTGAVCALLVRSLVAVTL